jgi:hypothetical protein
VLTTPVEREWVREGGRSVRGRIRGVEGEKSREGGRKKGKNKKGRKVAAHYRTQWQTLRSINHTCVCLYACICVCACNYTRDLCANVCVCV